MKLKLMLTVACLSLAACAFAQNRQNNGRQRGQRGNFDMVVDTAIVNRIGLDKATYDKVLTLQKNKQQEMQTLMQNSRPEKGQKMSDADRKAMMEKREAFTKGYRAEFRNIIGTEKYIEYLEKQVDRQQMGGNRGQRPGGNRNGNQQRQQRQRGNEGEGGFGGGFED